MERKYIAFDIETAKLVPEGEHDWESYRPLGISCAATFGGADGLTLWHGGKDRTCPADRMSKEEAGKLVEYLATQAENGFTPLSFNGLGFDLNILAEESGMLRTCRELAINHVDIMFHVHCRLGFPVSLDAAARGMKIAGKPEGMNGAMAPVLWAEGKQETVLQYVAQDVKTTLELATACEAGGAMRWITRSGKPRTMALPDGWLPVKEAENLPEPYTAWMSEPWSRAKFTAWTHG